MSSTTLAYRLGDADAMCRYPVIIGGATILGYVSRWHRNWNAESSAGTHLVGRPPVGKPGGEWAAAYLVGEYAEGRITPIPAQATSSEAAHGPAPLLDPRMPDTPTNRTRALAVLAILAEYEWTPRSGFPGADNLMLLHCNLCGTTVPRFWSHLRGRNSQPPSPYRHRGCLSADEVRRRVPAYGPSPAS
ncbi:hypothetical protein [Streptomyces sp. NPDC047973]|uniref:hypothetical protein n=1 Tax=Streptomyces sp. NPDC047973 TaxID=3155383 RepID=UPI00341B5267